MTYPFRSIILLLFVLAIVTQTTMTAAWLNNNNGIQPQRSQLSSLCHSTNCWNRCSTSSRTSSSSSSSSSTVSFMVKRGRGSNSNSFGKQVMGDDDTNNNLDTSSSSSSGMNWIPINVSSKDSLPNDENIVRIIDTNLISLQNSQTNPTGAISVIKYQNQYYSFAVNCPTCQIPLLQAKCISTTNSSKSKSSPTLVCDLCQSTYNLQTGEKVTIDNDNQQAVPKVGFMKNIMKSVFASKTNVGPLPIYKLGEKNGKLLIGL